MKTIARTSLAVLLLATLAACGESITTPGSSSAQHVDNPGQTPMGP